jgi:hypothetical protein
MADRYSRMTHSGSSSQQVQPAGSESRYSSTATNDSPVYPLHREQSQQASPPPYATSAAPSQQGRDQPAVAPPQRLQAVTGPPRQHQYNDWNASRGFAPAHRIPDPNKNPLGNSRRACCCIWTADASHSVVLAFFVLLPTAVFTSSVVAPSEWYSIVVPWVLTILALAILVCAVGIDPGIIPPASVTGQRYDPDSTVTIVYEGQQCEVPVCRTCLIPRPPGSSHCHQCDYCVEEYDHHCGVLGSCVAKRTFRFFAYFFDVTTLLAGYIFARSVFEATENDWSSTSADDWHRWRAVAIIGCIIYTAIGGCCVFGQSAFYTKLACDDMTQKKLYGRGGVQQQHRAAAGRTHDPVYDTEQTSCVNYFKRKCGRLPESNIAKYISV